jgi:CRP-like cAMP-binding protein
MNLSNPETLPRAAYDSPAAGPGFDVFLRKLRSHSMLTTEDQRLLASLPHQMRRLAPNEYILREGDQATVCPILLSGIAFRQKHVPDGGRQIVAVKIPGDPLDFQSLYLATADHSLQALTAVELAVYPLAALEQLVMSRPTIARAVLVDILVEASIGREWQLNIGRRNALERLAHFLSEFDYRMRLTVRGLADGIEIPMTQEQLADMLGLTPVHINRTLKTLAERGALTRAGRKLRIADIASLHRIAGFSDHYLHSTVSG